MDSPDTLQASAVTPNPDDTPPSVPFLRFEAVCGRGGMAVVWRARHESLGRPVAVKVLNKAFSSSPDDVRRFMTEGRTMSYLDHPGIVHAYGTECVGGRYLCVMDYIEGYTLGHLLARKRRLPEGDALIILESVARALDYAWRSFRIIHCDIKPDNLMVDADGSVKIADLGLAREVSFETASAAPAGDAVILGSPAYMSPEQIYADVALDCRTDIYSLGATIYHLVTGRTLFPGLSGDNTLLAQVDDASTAPDPRLYVPELSENLVRLLIGLLAKDRDRRFPDWNAVFAACRTIEEGGTLPAPAPDLISSVSVTPVARNAYA